jgi:hypothetical protein
MAEGDLIEGYVRALDRQLRGFWPARARILEEVRAHLDDAAAVEVQQGAAPEAARRVAAARFGAVDAVARRFAEERVESRLASFLPRLAVGSLLLLASDPLEKLFPVQAVFHASAPEFIAPMVLASRWLEGMAVVLIGAAFLLRRRMKIGPAAHCASLGFSALTVGVGGVAFARLFHDMATLGSSHGQPMLIRLVFLLVLFVASAPLLAAIDARSAVLAPTPEVEPGPCPF